MPAVLLVAFACSLPALRNGLAGDDQGLIVSNPQLAAASPLPLFSRAFASGAPAAYRLPVSYYRPLTSLSFWLDRRLWGLNPLPYHLHNLLLNVLATALVFLVLNLLLASPAFAALGSLLFALRPMHAEPIAWISGRTDLLMSVLVLAAFYLFLRSESRLRNARRQLSVFGVAAFTLALLAKETAVVFPAFYLLWFIFARTPGPRTAKNWTVPAVLFVLTAGFLTARSGILGSVARLTPDTAPGQFPVLMLNTLGLYIKLFFAPFSHRPYYPFRPDFLSADAYGLLAVLFTVTALILLGRLRERVGSSGLWWALLFLLPVLNLLFLSGPIAAERFLYLPSFGLILLLATIVRRLTLERRRLAAVATALSLVAASLLATNLLAAIPVWRSDLSLAEAMVKATPDFPMARNSLGVAYYSKGERALARQEFQHALDARPDYLRALVNLARLELAEGNPDSARPLLEQARQLAPNDPQVRALLPALTR